MQVGRLATRFAKSLAVARGNPAAAAAYAESQGWPEGAKLAAIIKASVSASDVADSSGLLAEPGFDLVAAVRPRTILGRLRGVRNVPFRVLLSNTTSGPSAGWVGGGKAIPVTRASFSTQTRLELLKVGGIAVVTDELAQSSAVDAETAIGQELINACVQAADSDFILPSNTGSAGIKPAAITAGAGVTPRASSGATLSAIDNDLGILVQDLIEGGSTLEFAAWAMHTSTLVSLAKLRGSGGTPAFPNLNVVTGGTLWGLPVIPSGAVTRTGSPLEGVIALVDGDAVWLADSGAAEITAGKHTALQLLDNPTNAATDTVTATTMVSMFQTGSIAIRATRPINWQRVRNGAAAVLTGVSY